MFARATSSRAVVQFFNLFVLWRIYHFEFELYFDSSLGESLISRATEAFITLTSLFLAVACERIWGLACSFPLLLLPSMALGQFDILWT